MKQIVLILFLALFQISCSQVAFNDLFDDVSQEDEEIFSPQSELDIQEEDIEFPIGEDEAQDLTVEVLSVDSISVSQSEVISEKGSEESETSSVQIDDIYVTPAGVEDASNDLDLTAEDEDLLGHSIPSAYSVATYKNIFKQNKSVENIDVVFVLDKSNSMVKERSQLKTKMDSFFNSLGESNWRLGVITSDSKSDKGSLQSFSNGALYIDQNTESYKQEFFDLVSDLGKIKGVSDFFSSNYERPIESSIKLMKSSTEFFRKDSRLVFVIVSNEDEQGKKTETDFLNTVEVKFGKDKSVFVYSFIIKPGDTKCYAEQSGGGSNPYGKGGNTTRSNTVSYGKTINALSELTEGSAYDLCSTKYQDILKEVAEKSITSYQTRFKLSHIPLEDSVQVEIDPADPELTWELDKDVIIFNKPPAPGVNIRVIFKSLLKNK